MESQGRATHLLLVFLLLLGVTPSSADPDKSQVLLYSGSNCSGASSFWDFVASGDACETLTPNGTSTGDYGSVEFFTNGVTESFNFFTDTQCKVLSRTIDATSNQCVPLDPSLLSFVRILAASAPVTTSSSPTSSSSTSPSSSSSSVPSLSSSLSGPSASTSSPSSASTESSTSPTTPPATTASNGGSSHTTAAAIGGAVGGAALVLVVGFAGFFLHRAWRGSRRAPSNTHSFGMEKGVGSPDHPPRHAYGMMSTGSYHSPPLPSTTPSGASAYSGYSGRTPSMPSSWTPPAPNSWTPEIQTEEDNGRPDTYPSYRA